MHPRDVYQQVAAWLRAVNPTPDASPRRRLLDPRGQLDPRLAPIWLPDQRPSSSAPRNIDTPPPPPPPPPPTPSGERDIGTTAGGFVNQMLIAGAATTFHTGARAIGDKNPAYMDDNVLTPDVSPEWTQDTGAWSQSANRLIPAVDDPGSYPIAAMLYNRYTYRNGYVESKVYNVGALTTHSLFFRGSFTGGAYSGYLCRFTNGNVEFVLFDAGVDSTLTDDVLTLAEGDQIRVKFNGSAFTALVNGVQVLATADATHTTGRSGIGLYNTAVNGEEFGVTRLMPL